MRFPPATLIRHGAAWGVACALLACVPAQASEGHDAHADGASGIASSNAAGLLIQFDIPAQTLATALDRFAALSGRSALFSSTLAVGRTAPSVHGRYTPLDALRRLLEGTGLTAEEVITGSLSALVVKQASPQALASAAAQRAAAQDRLRAYDSLLQARVWEALCADPRTARQDYQSLLRFQVGAGGQVTGAELLGTTGERRRDAALVSALGRVQIGRAPPPDLAQPVTLLILPPQDGGPACAAEAT